MAKGYVIMGDIVNSANKDGKQLMTDFKLVAEKVKKKHKSSFLSPITITLGDEFQAIVDTLTAAVEVIFTFEETLVREAIDINMRYVVQYGTVDTDINSKIAYEMLGEGLTAAREHLIQLKKNRDLRLAFYLQNAGQAKTIEQLFFVFTTIIDKWKIKDAELLGAFIELGDYKTVADRLSLNRSQLWKREKALMIREYLALRSAIHYLSANQ